MSTASNPSSTLFPTYLLPPFPFFRRSKPQTASVHTQPTPPNHYTYLRCARCSSDLCLSSQIISKGFTGRHGRAYLVRPSPSPTTAPKFATSSARRRYLSMPQTEKERIEETLPNTHVHKPVPRQLVTGAHTVSDISCVFCGSVVGWKYVEAEEESQRYKVGMCILETRRVRGAVEVVEPEQGDEDNKFQAGEDAADNDDDDEGAWEVEEKGHDAKGDIEFDSQDEDECEDLFAGVWDARVVAARRKRGRFSKAAAAGRAAAADRF